MFSRYNNTKRGAALLGVMLALLSGMEGSHLLCQMGVCSIAVAEDGSDQHGESVTCICSNPYGCAATGEPPASNRQVYGCDQGGSCPCPPTCWCKHAPQPFELPKDSSPSVEILFLALSSNSSSVALGTDPVTKPGIDCLFVDSPHVTSTERCARLCRFLI